MNFGDAVLATHFAGEGVRLRIFEGGTETPQSCPDELVGNRYGLAHLPVLCFSDVASPALQRISERVKRGEALVEGHRCPARLCSPGRIDCLLSFRVTARRESRKDLHVGRVSRIKPLVRSG